MEGIIKYKPFDLERAKAGDEVVTRDGRKVRIICFDYKDDFPIVSLAQEGRNESLITQELDGCFHKEVGPHKNDLFMKPKNKTLWINIYKQWDEYWTVVNESKEDAQQDKRGEKHFLSTHKIEIEE